MTKEKIIWGGKQYEDNKYEILDKTEIEDFLDVNSKEDIIKYIYDLEVELLKYKKGLETARMMLSNRVTKDRYNDIVKKYNKLLKGN